MSRPPAAGFDADPTPAVERVFGDILRQRMADVPLINPALRVEAVGFSLTGAGWLGVVITPWFMNLMFLPAAGAAWRGMPLGEKRLVTLPAGTFEFFGGEEEGLGEYLYCSMFSPMSQFPDHESARATAGEICRMVLDPAVGQQVKAMNPTGLKWFEVQPEKPAGATDSEPGKSEDVSPQRRAFLRGRSRPA